MASTAQIDEKVKAATNVCDVPELVQALADRVKELETSDTKQDDAEIAQAGVIASLQSQMLWICGGCILFGAAAGQIVTRVFL